MEQVRQYSTRWVQSILASIYIYGARFIILLLCYCQDTESESQEIKIVVVGSIFTK